MNTFDNINALRDQFKSGGLSNLPPSFVIEGVTFNYVDEIDIKLSEMAPNKAKLAVIYESSDNVNNYHTVFVWQMNNQHQIIPTSVELVERTINEADERDIARHYDEKTIGKSLDVILMGLNDNQPIKCKVDTGAELCSLDAQDIKIVPNPSEEGELVKFTFNDKVYTVALKQQQAVQTADGGVNYRPVISLGVKFNGQSYADVLFNLNDRSDMPNPILLGLNFLEKGDFLIDPKKESYNIELSVTNLENIHKLIESVPQIHQIVETTTVVNEAQIQSVVETIYNNPDVTLADILRHMKSDTLKTLENITY